MAIKSYDNLIIDSFNRIKNGFYFNENYQPYTEEFMNVMIEYFISKEEYESCQILKNLMNKRFTHENGYEDFI